MATPDPPEGNGSIEFRQGTMGAHMAGWRHSSAPPLMTEGIHVPNGARCLGRLEDLAKHLPHIDLTQIAELIESCRAHAASVATLAGVTSKALDHYGYEENEPHLGQCCELVQQVLNQTESTLGALGVISHDVEPRLYAKEVAKGCELQRRSLTRAMHVVRATSAILGTFESNSHDHVLLALYDLESGIQLFIDGLQTVTKS